VVLYGIITGVGPWYMWVFSFLWWQFLAAFVISAGYHRYFSHKTFKAGSWYKYFVQYFAIFANPGPVIAWASSHRMHHSYTDTEKDPHSPKIKGFWTVYSSFWGYDTIIEKRFLKDLLRDKSIVFFHKHYFNIVLITILCLLVIDPKVLFFVFCVPVVLAFHGFGMINAVCHATSDVRNSFIANLLTAGEGYHANHHKRPYDAKIGSKWYHLDTGFWAIKLIEKK
jgi:stearoyl-CoA desaturase (delta-9 desaturase)